MLLTQYHFSKRHYIKDNITITIPGLSESFEKAAVEVAADDVAAVAGVGVRPVREAKATTPKVVGDDKIQCMNA